MGGERKIPRIGGITSAGRRARGPRQFTCCAKAVSLHRMEPTVINYLLGQYQPHRDTLLMLFRLNAPYAATPNPETKRDMSDPPEDLEVGRESD